MHIIPITYPARPVNGGPLEKALPKSGDWFYEPKVNGWRVLIHVPTGAMFNRNGGALSIAMEFGEVLRRLKNLPFEWLDCEALERRHNLGKGSLVVLDWVTESLTYEQRRAALCKLLQPTDPSVIRENCICALPAYVSVEVLWDQLQEQNRQLGCEFFEGAVAKKADSRYPIQLQSPHKEFPFWVKHRWRF